MVKSLVNRRMSTGPSPQILVDLTHPDRFDSSFACVIALIAVLLTIAAIGVSYGEGRLHIPLFITTLICWGLAITVGIYEVKDRKRKKQKSAEWEKAHKIAEWERGEFEAAFNRNRQKISERHLSYLEWQAIFCYSKTGIPILAAQEGKMTLDEFYQFLRELDLPLPREKAKEPPSA